MNAQDEMQGLLDKLARLNTAAPFPLAPKPEPVTPEQIAAIVDASLKRAMPQLMGMVQSLDDFFNKALPADELAAFKKYRDDGAPGLVELMASSTLYPIAQLLWDEIKGNLK